MHVPFERLPALHSAARNHPNGHGGIQLSTLPALGFLGYLAAGTRIGVLIVDRGGPPDPNRKPYLAAVVGLLILQVIVLIPFISGLIAFLAALYGARALACYAFQSWKGRRLNVTGEGPVSVAP